MTEHTTSESLLLAVCHPDQCCAGWCVDEIGLHDVDRDTAEVAAERACMWLADRLAAVQAEAKKWERLALGTSMAHDTALARAESAEAQNARLRARLEAVEALFAGGPDTPCRTTWRREEGLWGEEGRVECVEVPMDDLRAVLDSPTSHAQREAEVVKAGRGDDSDVEAGRCCPHCRNGLTDHNRLVWNAGYAIGQRHARADALAADTTNP